MPSCFRVPPERVQGSWHRPARSVFGAAACIDASGRRGLPAAFDANCTIRTLKPSALRGLKLMLIGDSLMQYQFAALVAWLGRAGRPLKCTPVSQQTLDPRGTVHDDAVSSAVQELAFQDPYDGGAQDCERPGLSLYSRRLNLLPPAAELIDVLDTLFAPLRTTGEPGQAIAVINVGLWYDGPLARHAALAELPKPRRLAAALALLSSGVGQLSRAACQRPDWPHIIWREHLPQHFRGGGSFRMSLLREDARSATRGQRLCRPLSQQDAAAMYERLSRPALAAIANASSLASRHACPKPRRVTVLPAFWPLVSRHMDHDGSRLRPSARRADCTHYLPCSGSMMLLNRMLLDAVMRRTASSSRNQPSSPRARHREVRAHRAHRTQ